MASIDQLVGRAQKAMYRNVADLVSEEILKAGTNALIIINHESRMYSGRKILPQGFNGCVQAWIAEAARQGIKAEHVGQPDCAYYDEGAKLHAIMAGTVRIIDTNQLLVVAATNYRGRYHVVQVRAISEENDAVEARCFNPVAV